MLWVENQRYVNALQWLVIMREWLLH